MVLTLQIEDNISDKFLGLLNNFSKNEVKILEETQTSDDFLVSQDLKKAEKVAKNVKSAYLELLEARKK
jgi:hypothetical protein